LAKQPAASAQPANPPWYSYYGNCAQIASALFAAIGFSVVAWQIGESRHKASEEAYRTELSEGRKLYVSYSEAALKYPQLAMPDYDELLRNKVEYERYQNFVSHMLYAYDEMLYVTDRGGEHEAKDEWQVGFEVEIEPHQRYLCQISDPRFFKMFRPGMQARLKQRNDKLCKDEKPLGPRP
jgi:hypothetical protein